LEKSTNNIDQQLKGMFETFQPAVPFQFEKIESRMDAKKSKRRSVLLWSSVATVVFTAVSGIIILKPDTAEVNYGSISKKENNSKEINNSSNNSNEETVNSANPTSDEIIAEEIPSVTSSSMDASKIEANNNLNLSNSSISINNSSNNIIAQIASDELLRESQIDQNNTEVNTIYSDFSGKSIQTIPTSFGYFLQLPVRFPSPQMPIQPLSSWAFEVGYDQNQTAMAYQISPGREQYVHKNYITRMKEGEFALNAPQLQASLKYYVNSNWSVSLGLGFAQTRTMQRFDFRDSVPVSIAQGFESDALGNFPIFGYLGLGQEVKYEGIQTIQMLSIPMAIGYQFPINRFWSFNSEISTRYNRLFATQGNTLNYHDLSLLQANDEVYRSGIWSARLSAGAEYRMSRNQYLGLRVNTQGAFTPLYKKDASVVNRGWSLGMSVFYTMKLF